MPEPLNLNQAKGLGIHKHTWPQEKTIKCYMTDENHNAETDNGNQIRLYLWNKLKDVYKEEFLDFVNSRN